VVKLTGVLRVWSVNTAVYKNKMKAAKSTEFYYNRSNIPYTSTEL